MIPDPEILREFEHAMDHVLDQISESKSFPFDSENFNRAAFSILVKAFRNLWRTRRKCLYPGCNARSILRSHTLSRSLMLSEIQESRHVLTPKFDMLEGAIVLRKISEYEASTFSGLCDHHENIFLFEKDENFHPDSAKTLQLFRTIVRECAVAQHYTQRFRRMRRLYLKTRNERVAKEIMTRLSARFPKERITLANLNYKIRDWRLVKIINEYLRKKAQAAAFVNTFLRPFATDSGELTAVVVLIPFQIPVALAGRATLHATRPTGGPETFDVILNVIPHESATTIMLLSRTEFGDVVTKYMEVFAQNQLSALEMVEAWMLHGSDHWFIRPSVWSSMPVDRQKVIQNDVLCVTKGISQFYRHSIFDELRAALLAELPMDPPFTSGIDYRTVVQRNRRKLKRKVTTSKLINHYDKIVNRFFADGFSKG